MNILILIFSLFILLIVFLRIREFLRERKIESTAVITELLAKTGIKIGVIDTTAIKKIADEIFHWVIILMAIIVFIVCVNYL